VEFRCRLGTPGGEVVEGVYVADSEARLRREFEEKGLYVLGIQRAGGLSFGSIPLPHRRRIPTREFLVFNQELATLLKAGMPLVQSLDILRQRVPNPLSSRCSTTCTSGCGGAARCRRRSRRTGSCSRASTWRRCWPARRAAASSR
jgi:type II secretory pathway component PulF